MAHASPCQRRPWELWYAREGLGRALAEKQRRIWQENSGTECPKTEKALAGLWQGFGMKTEKTLAGKLGH
jgi:hypothetical protein